MTSPSWEKPEADDPDAHRHRGAAVATLSHAPNAAPDAVADLLCDPLIGAWAAGGARRLRGEKPPEVPPDAECATRTPGGCGTTRRFPGPWRAADRHAGG